MANAPIQLPLDPHLPSSLDVRTLVFQLTTLFRQNAILTNNLANGHIQGRLRDTAAPTTGTHQLGDIVYNSAPAELGIASSQYVILGWICTAAGTPGTWLEMRTLTGN